MVEGGGLYEASPRAIVLVLPHIRWKWPVGREDLTQRWAAAASAVPYTEEVVQSVVDTLLQIASQGGFITHPRRLLVVIDQVAFPPTCLPGTYSRNLCSCHHGSRGTQGGRDSQALLPYHPVRVELVFFSHTPSQLLLAMYLYLCSSSSLI